MITAEAVSETRSKKHIPATMAKDKKRARRKLAKLLPGLGLTPQMVFNASWSWPNTPLAPKKRDRDSDHGCDQTGRRLARTRGDVLHSLGAAAVEERIKVVQISRRATSLLP